MTKTTIVTEENISPEIQFTQDTAGVVKPELDANVSVRNVDTQALYSHNYRTSSQLIPRLTSSTWSFTNTINNNPGEVIAVAGLARVPKDGVYQINGHIVFDTNITGFYRKMTIRNYTLSTSLAQDEREPASQQTYLKCSAVYELTKGQEIQILVEHNADVSINVASGFSYLELTRIGTI